MEALTDAANRVISNEVLDQRQSWFRHGDSDIIMGASIHRDLRRLSRIIFGDGKIPIVSDWNKEYRGFTTHLQRQFGEKVKVKFVHVQEEGNYVVLDDNCWIEEYDMLVVHGDRLVYVAVPSPALCVRCYREALSVMGMDVEITEYHRDLMQYFGNENKKLQFPPSSLNFGISARPQSYGLVVKKPSVTLNTLTKAALSVYLESFEGVYIKQKTLPRDKYHKNRKGCQRLRQTFEGPLFSIPLTLKDTYDYFSKQKVTNGMRRLSILENKLRSVSEYLLAKVFYSLPYGTLPFIGCKNLEKASEYLKEEDMKEYFPVARALPKGTLGMYPSKTMHDDDNGAISPSIWTSVVGDDDTTLTFYGVNFEVSLSTTTNRFCWFMGWIPHKSKSKNPRQKRNNMRVNHSAYTKPEFEHFVLTLLCKNKKIYRATMNNIQYK